MPILQSAMPLVIWGGEFGRTPTAQFPDGGYVKEIGRDHDPFGFTMWLAGGGVKGGTTDECGYFAIENKVHVHDLHATILHLLGLDHTKLTYPFSGRNMRLTMSTVVSSKRSWRDGEMSRQKQSP